MWYIMYSTNICKFKYDLHKYNTNTSLIFFYMYKLNLNLDVSEVIYLH